LQNASAPTAQAVRRSLSGGVRRPEQPILAIISPSRIDEAALAGDEGDRGPNLLIQTGEQVDTNLIAAWQIPPPPPAP